MLVEVKSVSGINIGYSSQQLPFCNAFDPVRISFGGIKLISPLFEAFRVQSKQQEEQLIAIPAIEEVFQQSEWTC